MTPSNLPQVPGTPSGRPNLPSNVTGKLNMWRRLLTSAVLLAVAAGAVSGGVIRYDQSQTGDYNVHLDMKNVEVLAILGDSPTSFGGEVSS